MSSTHNLIETAERLSPSARRATVYDLPTEILIQTLSDFTPHELWPLLGVCQTWREALQGCQKLWRKVDMNMFKLSHRKSGVIRVFGMSNLSAHSISYINLPRTRNHDEWTLAHDPYTISATMNQLTELKIDSVLLSHHAWVVLTGIRCLEVHQKTPEFMMIRLLDAFPNLENLVIRELVHACLPELKQTGACETLRQASLTFTDGASMTEPHIFNLEELASAAPSLETLEIKNLSIRRSHRPHDGVPGSGLGFDRMVNLKSLTLHDIDSIHDFPSILPPNLEMLNLRYKKPGLRGFLYPNTWPTMPKLKHLETNFDGLVEGVGHTIWVELLTRSGCKLETLVLDSSERDSKIQPNAWSERWALIVFLIIGAQRQVSELASIELRFPRFLQLDDVQSAKFADERRAATRLILSCPKLKSFVWRGAVGDGIKLWAEMPAAYGDLKKRTTTEKRHRLLRPYIDDDHVRLVFEDVPKERDPSVPLKELDLVDVDGNGRAWEAESSRGVSEKRSLSTPESKGGSSKRQCC